MAAAVFVIVLRFGNGIVNVNRWHFKFVILQHFIQSMHTGRRFFCNTVNVIEHIGVFVVNHFRKVTAVIQNHIGIPWLSV